MPDHSPDDSGGSPERFGYSWGTYSELLPEHEEQFRRWTCHLEAEQWQGLRFLDVGCGMGRNSYWPMRYGAAGGRAIDLDQTSLAAARQTLEAYPEVEVCEASGYEIGVQSEFDIAFSIGVIHHLEFPERALQEMKCAVKPGGRVLIWVYGYENNEWIVRWLNPLRKLLFSRLPLGLVHALSLLPTVILWLALRLGLDRIAYFRLIRGFAFGHLRAIVFDQMLPRIAHYWRREQVAELMAGAGLEEISISWVNQMSWSAIGQRPQSETQADA
jgi:SAM-dependent methyltransferase